MARGGFAGLLLAGRYRLVDGAGRHWTAVDERLRAGVAVEQVALPPAGQPAAVAAQSARAERELRHAAQLRNHPNVLAVLDVVAEHGALWVVTEQVAGRTLEEEVRAAGPVAGPRLSQLASALLEALGAAHAVGVVHRGVEPSRVLLAADGRVLLTGFGIPAGTSEYAAPEGREATAAGDVFSCGATLRYAAAGPPGGALARLLAQDPASRPTAAQALYQLRSAPSHLPAPAPAPAVGPDPDFDFDFDFDDEQGRDEDRPSPNAGRYVFLRTFGGFLLAGAGLAMTAYLLLSYLGDPSAAASSVTAVKVAVEAVTAGAAVAGGVIAQPGGSPQERLYVGAGAGVLVALVLTLVIANSAEVTGLL